MIEAQEWEGSDIIKYSPDYCDSQDPEYDDPLCFDQDFDMLAIHPEDERMANLYDHELVGKSVFSLKACH